MAVYIPVIALTPLTVRLYQRWPQANIVGFAVAIIAIDLIRFFVSGWFGVLNLIVAWAFVHQLGYYYHKGVSKRASWTLLLTGLFANIALTTVLEYYPKSLVGIPTEAFSNVAPPTMILMFHAMFLFGLFTLLAPMLRKVFARPRPLRATIAAGVLAMSVYLWHMFILSLLVIAIHYLRIDLPTRLVETHSEGGDMTIAIPPGPAYWLLIIPFATIFGVLVYLAAKNLWFIEFLKLPLLDKQPRYSLPSWLTPVGIIIVSVGLLGIAGAGFSGFPWTAKETFGLHLYAWWFLLAIFGGTVLLSFSVPHTRVKSTDVDKK